MKITFNMVMVGVRVLACCALVAFILLYFFADWGIEEKDIILVAALTACSFLPCLLEKPAKE